MQSQSPNDDDRQNEPPAVPAASEPPRTITTEDLFAGRREIWIQHGDQRYRLRITAAGKLILTK